MTSSEIFEKAEVLEAWLQQFQGLDESFTIASSNGATVENIPLEDMQQMVKGLRVLGWDTIYDERNVGTPAADPLNHIRQMNTDDLTKLREDLLHVPYDLLGWRIQTSIADLFVNVSRELEKRQDSSDD